MRVILAHIESETIKEFLDDAGSLSEWKEGQLLSDRRDQKQDPSVRVVYSHIKLLAKGGYIEGLHVQESLDGFFDIGISANPVNAMLYDLAVKSDMDRAGDIGLEAFISARQLLDDINEFWAV